MRALAEWTYLRAGLVLAGAFALVALAAPLAADVFDRVEPFDISDPGSEVERAYDRLEAATGAQPDPGVLILVTPGGDASEGAGARRIVKVAAELEVVDGVARVESPEARPELLSADGNSGLVIGYLAAGSGRVQTGRFVEEAFSGEPDLKLGGIAVAAEQLGRQSEEDSRKIELFAAPVLLLLCLWVFRSPIAAALPLLLSGISIVLTFAALSLLSEFTDIDLFSLQVVTGLGVGLAIDYSIFILARFRIEIRHGHGIQTAQLATLSTAGRTVAFSALTVAAALAALILFPQQFLSSTGIAGGIVAVISGAVALIILPAAMALLGPRIDPALEAGEVDAGGCTTDPLTRGGGLWATLPRRVMGRPLPVATVSLLAMLAIASPALGGKLTTPDARVLPEEESARMVFDSVASSFPELPTSTVQIYIPPDASSAAPASREFADVGAIPGVLGRPQVQRLPDGGGQVVVFSSLDPLSDAGQDQLAQLRAAPWPNGTLVGGRAAELADQRASISDSAPLVVAVVVITNLLLVLIMVRSLVLPLVSLLLNALTVLASYGLMVAIFENSTPAELLGTFAQDGIDVSVPILAFAVVFGLSTDYGIFLFSRIKEARDHGSGDEEAVIEGIASTGRLITASAVIFSVAVGAFAFSDLVIVKEFAVAVALAVLIDASVVRGLLLPSILKLLGARAWAWPGAGAPGR